jgi:heme/copper-type cytochrome/quinol oxidase subunit 2
MLMKYPWICLLLAATTCPLTSHGVPTPAPENVQVVDVTAKKYEFSPSPIRVKQGTKVQLKITATDHAHGFRISPFASGAEAKGGPGLAFSSSQGCVKIEEGHTETVEFVAQAPGTYPFSCCVHCGWKHRSMKGELIVEP